MRHQIRTEQNGIRVKIRKSDVFKGIYSQIKDAFAEKIIEGRMKEIWRQVHKLCGEYVGNLYKHDSTVNFAEIEVNWQTNGNLRIVAWHDGDEWDQFSGRVRPISAGLFALGVTPQKFYGTGSYDGFTIDIQIGN